MATSSSGISASLARLRQDLRVDGGSTGSSAPCVAGSNGIRADRSPIGVMPGPPVARLEAVGQRGANAQPGGSCAERGTVPWIACSRARRAAGIDASRPRV
jgi:hypothetical protein